MKAIITCMSAALVLGGLAPLSSAWAAFDPAQFANVCPPQTTVLHEGCGTALCQALSDSSGLDPADQKAFGTYLASLINQYGNTNPQVGDKIQGCIAAGPGTLVAAYETGRGENVAEIGKQFPASPH